MDWNMFWNAFGAIGTTFGSIVTAIAVVVALKQFKQPITKRIKIDFTLGLANLDGTDNPSKFYSIEIANKGIRECIVNSIFIEGKKENLYLNTAQYKSLVYTDFPQMIKPEETISVFFSYDRLRQDFKQKISEGWIPKYRKLRIKVMDSSGDVHYGKTKIKFLKAFK